MSNIHYGSSVYYGIGNFSSMYLSGMLGVSSGISGMPANAGSIWKSWESSSLIEESFEFQCHKCKTAVKAEQFNNHKQFFDSLKQAGLCINCFNMETQRILIDGVKPSEDGRIKGFIENLETE